MSEGNPYQAPQASMVDKSPAIDHTHIEFINPQMGKNDWWRYVMGISIWVFTYLFVTFIVGLFLVDFSASTKDNLVFKTNISPLLFFTMLMLPHIASMIAILIVVRRLHERPALTLITNKDKFSWPLFFKGFIVYGILIAAAAFLTALLYPDSIKLSYDVETFWPFFLVVMLIIPLQTTSEELFFRGYIMQITAKIKGFFAIAFLNAFIFMLPHLRNPEMDLDPLVLACTYFTMGFFLAYISLKSNRLEFALGIHAVNNLFCALVINLEVSVLKTESIFVCVVSNPFFDLCMLIIISLLFYYLVVDKEVQKIKKERSQ